jgi:exoribonuclease R
VKAPSPRVAASDLLDDLQRVKQIHHLPDRFPADVEAAAAHADPTHARWLASATRVDLTDVEFVTLDPAGSRDLDQAFFLRRDADGSWTLRYAIADVAAFVEPGGPIDLEAWRRIVTVYLPGARVALHPPSMSEGTASLLAGQTRAAVVWTMRLDADAKLLDATVQRAWVRSRVALDYDSAQRDLAQGRASEPIRLLADFGRLRRERERERGGASLQLPSQEINVVDSGYELSWRIPLVIEDDNAQLSLLTGMTAASLALGGGWAVLRTLPAPPDFAVDRLRKVARTLSIPWGENQRYGDVLAQLDRSSRAAVAFMNQAARLFRGAGYHCVRPDRNERGPNQNGRAEPGPNQNGRAEPGPSQRDAAAEVPMIHAAMAAPYSHVTAPLRRMGDRYATEVALSVVAGREPPEWVTARLDDLPGAMQAGLRVDSAVERSVTDAIEAALFEPLIGRELPAFVVNRAERGVVVVFDHPPAEALARGDNSELGAPVRVRVDAVDVALWRTSLSIVAHNSPGEKTRPPRPNKPKGSS